MKRNLTSRRPPARQRGAVAIMVAASMAALLSFVALAVDIGNVVYSERQLQAATDSAALAGAVDLWSNSWNNAYTHALSYTGGQGNALAKDISVTNTSVTGLQLASVALPYKQATSGYNGIQVTQQASVPMYFAQVFGVKTVSISSTSKAAAGGAGHPAQYNVVIIIDTTRSMATTTDSNCNNLTRLQCAKKGALTLLQGLTNAGDKVELMSFPPQQSSASYNFTCSGQAPSVASSYSASGASYQYTSSNQSSGSSGYLNSSGSTNSGSTNSGSTNSGSTNSGSSLVQALGGGNCSGLPGPGGLGTFYAQAIAQANAALATMSAGQNPPAQNAIVLLSDGIASSSTSQLGSKYSSQYGSECQAAINTAATAKASGTTIYTVAYLGGEGVSAPQCGDGNDALMACNTMESIATSQADFYSDTCTNAAGKTATLNQLFTEIAYSLTKPRLIPLSAT
jgi:Flp pilus assembly protein TadG